MLRYIVSVSVQTLVLIYKSVKLNILSWKPLVIRCVLPAILVLLSFLLIVTAPSGDNAHPSSSGTLTFPRCTGHNCVSLAFHPNTSAVRDAMSIFCQQTGLDFGTDVVATSSGNITDFLDYCFHHQNETQAGVFIDVDGQGSPTFPNISYSIIYNDTQLCSTFVSPGSCYESTNVRLRLQNSMDQALFTYFQSLSVISELESSCSLGIQLKPFPSQSNGLQAQVFEMFLPVFLLIAMSIPSMFGIYVVVSERASGLRGFMKIMGLTDAAWWMGTMFDQVVFQYGFSTAVVIGVGYLTFMDFFMDTNPVRCLCLTRFL